MLILDFFFLVLAHAEDDYFVVGELSQYTTNGVSFNQSLIVFLMSIEYLTSL